MTRYLTRSEWGARTTTPTPDRDGQPEPEVYVHHQAGRHTTTLEEERAQMRAMQAYAIDHKGYSDMDYSLVVGPSGVIYEGRGMQWTPAATRDRNAFSRAVCAMGNTDVRNPSPEQVRGIADAILLLILAGEVAPTATILGHRDNPAHPGATSCPGRFLYPLLPQIRRLVSVGLRPPAPEPVPEEDPLHVILAPDGLHARFLALMVKAPHGRWRADHARWIQTEAEMAMHTGVDGVPVWTVTLDDMKNVPLFGPIPHGDLRPWGPQHFKLVIA